MAELGEEIVGEQLGVTTTPNKENILMVSTLNKWVPQENKNIPMN